MALSADVGDPDMQLLQVRSLSLTIRVDASWMHRGANRRDALLGFNAP